MCGVSTAMRGGGDGPHLWTRIVDLPLVQEAVCSHETFRSVPRSGRV